MLWSHLRLVTDIMDEHSITLRAATPTLDDGLAFARYLDDAAEGFFRFMLGRRFRHIIAAAFAQPGHDLSYQNVTFYSFIGLFKIFVLVFNLVPYTAIVMVE